MYVSGASLTQATFAVVQCGLRDRTKHEAPCGREREYGRNDGRHDIQAHAAGNRAVTRHGRERLIGRRDQAPREGDTFRLVAIEERSVGSAFHHSGDLPGEIHRVADAGVHTLSTDGAVNVRRVAE